MNTLYYITTEMSKLYTVLYEADPQPDPNAAQPDPNAVAQDPNAAQPDPNAVAQDPNAAQPDPNAAQPDPNAVVQQADTKLNPMKQYMLYSKIKELKHYLELFAVNSESSEDTKNLIKFIGVVTNFYELFDYESFKILSDDIMKEADKIIKQRKKGEK